MFKRLVVAFLLVTAALSARAADQTDVYIDAAEPGWGAFLVQSNTFQFLAFFIYDVNKNPTFYTAQLTDDGTGNYTGGLYATMGTYFASPWNPSDHPPAVQVGTATFTPTDAYHATLKYMVNGVGTVTKSMVRQTLTAYQMTGSYSGGLSGNISSCNDPSQNVASARALANVSVTQVADASATVVITFVDPTYSGLVCTVSGALTHFGRLYQLNGQTMCAGLGANPNPHGATIDALHPTGQGIEGRWMTGLGGGCQGLFHISAVLNVSN